MYRLFVPKQAVGASLVYFDLFNAIGSTLDLYLTACQPVVSGEAAVTGVLGVDLFLTRTTAVGTGGTAATANGATLTACTITGANNSHPLPPSVTARLTPSGGATAGAVLSWTSVFTEETTGGTYTPSIDLAKLGHGEAPDILIPQGSGIRVVQGGVASVGNIGFNVIFRTAQR